MMRTTGRELQQDYLSYFAAHRVGILLDAREDLGCPCCTQSVLLNCTQPDGIAHQRSGVDVPAPTSSPKPSWLACHDTCLWGALVTVGEVFLGTFVTVSHAQV